MMSYKHFTLSERKYLQELLNDGYSIRKAAQALGRAPSSVSRELMRNNTGSTYAHFKAHKIAKLRKLLSHPLKRLTDDTELGHFVRQKLSLFWSPETIILQIRLRRKVHVCPKCGTETNQVHDYRTRTVRDLAIRGKPLKLLYDRRRYICPACGKRFSEDCTFLGKYQRFTYCVTDKILQLLHRRWSMKDIAKDTYTSVSGVSRCLSLFPQGKPSKLPKVLSFDEFKGNTNGEKFQCILTAPEERRILDILPDRKVSTIQTYLHSFQNRSEVQYVVMNMNKGYRDVAKAFLPNAKIVIDRFHLVRYCTWALDNVRRNIQKSLLPPHASILSDPGSC